MVERFQLMTRICTKKSWSMCHRSKEIWTTMPMVQLIQLLLLRRRGPGLRKHKGGSISYFPWHGRSIPGCNTSGGADDNIIWASQIIIICYTHVAIMLPLCYATQVLKSDAPVIIGECHKWGAKNNTNNTRQSYDKTRVKLQVGIQRSLPTIYGYYMTTVALLGHLWIAKAIWISEIVTWEQI